MSQTLSSPVRHNPTPSITLVITFIKTTSHCAAKYNLHTCLALSTICVDAATRMPSPAECLDCFFADLPLFDFAGTAAGSQDDAAVGKGITGRVEAILEGSNVELGEGTKLTSSVTVFLEDGAATGKEARDENEDSEENGGALKVGGSAALGIGWLCFGCKAAMTASDESPLLLQAFAFFCFFFGEDLSLPFALFFVSAATTVSLSTDFRFAFVFLVGCVSPLLAGSEGLTTASLLS